MFAKAHNVTPPMQPIQSNVDKSAIVTNAGSAVDPTTGNKHLLPLCRLNKQI